MQARAEREDFRLAGWTRAIERSALQEMLPLTARPGVLSFALGLPAAELFPTQEFTRAATRVLTTDRMALQYGPPFQPLKKHVRNLMAQRGVACREEEVFLTTGAQQGMNLLARLLLDPGGEIITEEMSYTGFRQVIEPLQPEILTVPTDKETGMEVEAVESLLRHGARPAFIYAISNGHNPLSVSMSIDKRGSLVELARQYRVPIMEDDAYGFLSYDNVDLPPMRALDDRWVFYVGSFSKVLAPALRVGWIILPETLIPKLSIVKEATDIDSSTFTQRAISAFLDSCVLPDHVAKLRKEYGSRRDAMIHALEEYFPAEAIWNRPVSGVFVWVELADSIDTEELLRDALEQEQVAYIPGGAFYLGAGRKPNNCMRLNFSNCPAEQIEDGIARLGRLLKRVSV